MTTLPFEPVAVIAGIAGLEESEPISESASLRTATESAFVLPYTSLPLP